jgi:TatD DNase family protein
MWFDSHCHLFDVDDPPAAYERARTADVRGILVLGVDVATSKEAIRLAASEGVWAGAAFHPEHVKGWEDGWAAEIEVLLSDDRVVAVGETGIDLHWDTSYLPDQVAAFEKHVELSKEHGKALVIHTRDSFDETAAVLERVGAPEKLVFHCWSGAVDQMRRALGLGASISFAGNVSFKNAGALRDVAKEVPPDRLLIETDAPYLSPVPFRGKPNEPANVTKVGEAVAAARGEPLDLIMQLTSANAALLFGVSLA